MKLGITSQTVSHEIQRGFLKMKESRIKAKPSTELPTAELKVDFDKPSARRLTWFHIVLLIISVHVFLILPFFYFVTNVLPGLQKDSPGNKADTSQGAPIR